MVQSAGDKEKVAQDLQRGRPGQAKAFTDNGQQPTDSERNVTAGQALQPTLHERPRSAYLERTLERTLRGHFSQRSQNAHRATLREPLTPPVRPQAPLRHQPTRIPLGRTAGQLPSKHYEEGLERNQCKVAHARWRPGAL